MATALDNLTDIIKLVPGYDPYATAAGAWFDAEAAQLAVDFFPECLRHIEGALVGQPFVLEDWEKAIVANLFGWKRKDSLGRIVRRYREAFIYTGRKNGKSPVCAGIGLYVFFCDDEAGQQNYIAAADREQAGMLFRHAKGMVEAEPVLLDRCRIYGGNASAGQSRSIVREQDGSFLRVISADASTKHGGNPHLTIIDELHAQPNAELYEVLHTAMASVNRAQPLFICITTADYDRDSICNERYDYACRVRDGLINDPSFLPVIYEAAATDDWTDPAVWAKANPNLGVSVSEDYLRIECEKAKANPRYQNTFRRLHLNQRTRQETAWLPMDKWAEVKDIKVEFPDGCLCYAGVDLASKNDLAAFVKVRRDQLGRVHVLPKFYVPEARVKYLEQHDKDFSYRDWVRRGLLTATPGNVIDYNFIIKDIVDDSLRYELREVGYDPWSATQTAIELKERHGIVCVEVRQGYASLSAPSKELERLLLSNSLVHGNNPVLTWMAGNVEVQTDPNGNIRPVKPDHGNKNKIDGIAATIIALARLVVNPDEGESVFDDPNTSRIL